MEDARVTDIDVGAFPRRDGVMSAVLPRVRHQPITWPRLVRRPTSGVVGIQDLVVTRELYTLTIKLNGIARLLGHECTCTGMMYSANTCTCV